MHPGPIQPTLPIPPSPQVLFCFTPELDLASFSDPGWENLDDAVKAQAAEVWPTCGWPTDWFDPLPV